MSDPLPPDDLAPAEPEAPPPPDPLLVLAHGLLEADAPARVAALSDLQVANLGALGVGAARADPSADWLDRLGVLRRAVLLHNQPPASALILAGIADVAAVLGEHGPRIEALELLVALRVRLDRPVGAHDMVLALAQAQADAGLADVAEGTLLAGIDRARSLAPVPLTVAEAGERMARTMRQLATLLAAQGRGAEAAEWRAGAAELAGG